MPKESGPSTRTRQLPNRATGNILIYHDDTYNGVTTHNVDVNQSVDYDFSGRQTTVSEGHPFTRKNTGLDDIGGDFFTTKSYATVPKSVLIQNSTTESYPSGQVSKYVNQYSGPLFPFLPADGDNRVIFPNSAHSSNDVLDSLGATAISRVLPTNSPADASTFLGELLHDGLPHLVGANLWRDRAQTLRTAGDEYLNYQFGWAPLVNDIRSFATAVAHADAVLKQYERDSGRVVRRKYEFPLKKDNSIVKYLQGGSVQGPNSSVFHDSAVPLGDVLLEIETSKKRWFSGAFTYHLPSDYDTRNKLSKYAEYANHILGLTLTPEVFWNLTPWSWAVDWFSNVGDVIHNTSKFGQDGLVMRYGYIMEYSIVKHTYSMTSHNLRGYVGAIPPVTLVTETKVRRRANPFGFGLSWEGLSSFQLSILSALGVTRGRR